MISKKGLSAIVATLLLILLTVSAIIIISNFIIPFINKSLESTSCFEFRNYFVFDDSFGFNCYEESGADKTYIITLKANQDNSSAYKIEGLALGFLSESSAIGIEIADGDDPGSIRMFDESIGSGKLVVPSAGGSYSAVTYNYSSTELYNRVKVYPIIKDNMRCEESDSIKLKAC